MKNYMATWTVHSRSQVDFIGMMNHLRCWESRKAIDILKSDNTQGTAEFGIISNNPDMVDEMLDGLSQYTSPHTEIVK